MALALDDRPVAHAAGFVFVAFLVSWTLFAAWYLLGDSAELAATAAYVGGGFGPTVAAVVLLVARGESLRAWGRRVLRVRLPVTAYLFAVVVPLAAVAVAGAVHVGFLGGPAALDALPSPAEYPLYLGFILLFAGGQEEPGWRGYLLPLLQREVTPLLAALLVGLVWSAWHAPLFVFPGTIQADIAVWLYVPNLVGLSVILTWLVNHSRASVLPAMLLHAGANAVANYYPVGGAVGATSVTGYGLLTGAVVVLAVGLVAASGPDLGEHRPHESGA